MLYQGQRLAFAKWLQGEESLKRVLPKRGAWMPIETHSLEVLVIWKISWWSPPCHGTALPTKREPTEV